MWRVNSSNDGKFAEFKRYLKNVERLQRDLPEPHADLLTIIRYKASKFENVLVDDTSLEVEGAEIGTLIRWKLSELEKHLGKEATFSCYLGIHRNSCVEVYRGLCKGTLVKARGGSFGFNKYFLPRGAEKTFGEEIPDLLNPRKKAVDDLLKGVIWKKCAPLLEWTGAYQK